MRSLRRSSFGMAARSATPFIMSCQSPINVSGASKCRTKSDGTVRMMLSPSNSAQEDGALRSCDHSAAVVTPEKMWGVGVYWIYYSSFLLMFFLPRTPEEKWLNTSPDTCHSSIRQRLTRFIIWCKHSHLHVDLRALHLWFRWGQQIDKATPQVPHRGAFCGDGISLVNARCSL